MDQGRARRWRHLELILAGVLLAVCVALIMSDRADRARLERDLHRDTSFTIALERLLSAVKDAETGQRGYLLTGDASYLAPFNTALPVLQHELDALQAIGLPTEDVPSLVGRRVASAALGIEMRTAGGLDRAVAAVIGGRGRELMDQLRARVANLQAETQARIDTRAALAARQSLQLTILLSLLLAVAIACVVVYAKRRRGEAMALAKQTRESEARFRSLAENSAAIIWTTSARGRFEVEQQQWCAFTGQTPAQSMGAGWAEAIHPDDREPSVQAWARAVSTHSVLTIEQRLRRFDGEWRHMAVQGVPVPDEQGGLREWVGTHTDITERRRAEAALAAARDAAEAANRSKSAFLANMSHELRTPLSAVIGYSEMLEEELEDLGQPQLLADIGKIESNARHLLRLINDVLDLSKIEANKMTSFAEDFDVATLAREAVGTVEGLVRKKANTLTLVLGEGLGRMHTDAVKLRQCLFNLISNAAKFTESGTISLTVARTASPTGDWLDFVVADSGIGMTEDQMSRLFQRFEQADASTTRNFGGTGLGLALTRAFCRLLGGDVSVSSRLGEGTVFTLHLPATLPDQVETEDAHLQAATLRGRELVLVIDDDASQRELLTRFLEREGFAVRTAADGRTGLDLARTLRPRAILLDVMMPQMDGWSVLTALKSEAALADIPVVMASFVNEPGLASALGAADYVLKPVEWARLKAVMARFRSHEGAVLVVDDDADARLRLRSVLEREGWMVAEAGDGAQALQAVAEHTPQLILLDLTMPVMDGFTFLDALRQAPGGAHIPVVVLSARDLSKTDRQRLDTADRVLRKGDVDLRDLPGQLAQYRQDAE